MTFLEELKRLCGDATPIPWLQDGRFDVVQKRRGGRPVANTHVFSDSRGNSAEENTANAHLIVYLANHAEDVVKLVETLEHWVDTWDRISPKTEMANADYQAFSNLGRITAGILKELNQ